jgi:hypothetical protein
MYAACSVAAYAAFPQRAQPAVACAQSVREQSTAGLQAARELKKAKESIAELFGKIRDIRFKAEQSEQMVQDICKDIRQLDVAKRHLTTTIIMLKRVQMLVSAVDSLQVRIRAMAALARRTPLARRNARWASLLVR